MRRPVLAFLLVLGLLTVPIALVACGDEACHEGHCHDEVDAMPADGGADAAALR